MLIVDTNDDVLNIEAGKINKFAHITFGKISDTYKIIQINTGNGLWTSNDMLLLCCITKEDPDIVIISESNFNINDPKMAQRRRNLFSGFIILDKVFQQTNHARLTVMIKDTHSFERMIKLENEINPCMVIKFKLSNNKYHNIVCTYRQWKGTAPLCSFNSRIDGDCILRLQELIKVWTNTINLGNPTFICGDINVDRFEANDPMRRSDLRNLIPLISDFQSTNNVVLVNSKPTRFRQNQRPTLIDLIMTNKPDLIKDHKNIINHCSEHFGVKCEIKAVPDQIYPQFMNIRSRVNLTSSNLMNLIESNQNLCDIFSMTDPDDISDTLLKELNNIINEIAPIKKVQITKYNRLKLNKELTNEIKEADHQVTVAKETMDTEEFRLAKRKQNRLKKNMEKARVSELKKNLYGKRKWNTIKSETNHENKIPTRIISDGLDIKKPKMIAETMNNYFISKIRDIRKDFNDKDNKAMELLENMIEKPKTSFDLQPVKVHQVYEIIDKAKRSNSTGHDSISMNVVKECPQFFARCLCHLYNSILNMKKYPANLKISKIIPIRKPGKPENEKESHRPINILPTVDKLIEAIMRTQLEDYFERNNLIPDSHHGGRRMHSTITAMTAIDTDHKKIKDSRKSACIMTTDLSCMFDLVDHKLLTEKLMYYGIKNNTIEILKDFLKNRKCFTEIQGYRSQMKEMDPVSVIQGSKLSGFLATIFSIEIPLLPELMKKKQIIQTLLEVSIPTFYGIDHYVNQYVDDSTNVMGAETNEELKKYVESYHKVLEHFYAHNKLKLNGQKTKIMITKNKEKTQTTKLTEFKTSKGEKIIEVNSMKILGIVKNNRDSYDSHLSMVSGRVNAIINDLSPLLGHMNLKTRKEVIYSKAASIALYGAELYTGQTLWTENKASSIIMRCNRAIYRQDWFKVSNLRICKAISVDPPDQMFKKATLNMFHRLIWNKSPQQLYKKIKFNSNHRLCSKLSYIQPPSKETNRRTALFSGLTLYNQIPTGMKCVHPKKFKKMLTKMKI